ncbi:MAG TPA: hypothetical protein VGH87_00355 [Polyangiaceae bacterium]
MVFATNARAGSMDPATERLVLQPSGMNSGQTCQSIAANPTSAPGGNPNNFPCAPDNVAFANLISELGFAMSPNAFHPARTTGFGGFALSVEASYTKINADAFSTAPDGTKTQYWHQGTRGATDPNTKNFSSTNSEPDSLLQIYSLKARKGLPLGFEITGALGYMANSSLWMLGADVRWAPFEGFRTGAGGILPDISVGGGVRTVMGTDKFSLTTVGMDVEISKPIPVASVMTITPYVGFQRLWVFGDSTVVDATPNTSAIDQCGYTGNDPVTGQPVCKNTLPSGAPNNGDFNNNFVFQKVRTERNRGIIGLQFRYEMMSFASQFLFDLTDPSAEGQQFLQSTRQWTLSFEVGVFF